MKAIASGDVITGDDIDVALFLHTNPGSAPLEVVQRNLATFKTHITTVAQTAGNQVLHNFLLAVNGDGFAGEFNERNTMKPAVQTQLNALVTKAFPFQAFSDSGIAQHFYTGMLQNSRTNAFLAIAAILCFQYDRCDSMLVQQMRQHQAGRPSANDSDLGFGFRHRALCYFCFSCSFRTSLAAWKAAFAAGIPQ